MAADRTQNLAQRIESLLAEHQQHADALARIEQTLEQIGAALNGGTGGSRTGRRRGRPPGSTNAQTGRKKRRGRGSFATTAEDFVISLVRDQKNPTSREINEAWKKEGRGHTADNTLTKLVKEKKLKRTPLGEGVRGSRYSLA